MRVCIWVFLFCGRISIVAFRMRQPYKLSGFSPDVDKWQLATRSDSGDARLPLEAMSPLLDEKKRRPNDNATQLGDLGLGFQRDIYFRYCLIFLLLRWVFRKRPLRIRNAHHFSRICISSQVGQSERCAQKYQRL